MKLKHKILFIVAALLAVGAYYYVTLPAISIHSTGFWGLIIFLLACIPAYYTMRKKLTVEEIRTSKPMKIQVGIVVAGILVFLVGSVLSSPIVNAGQYQQLLPVADGEFTEDIQELSYDQIPILDKDSAELLGNRTMGSIADMVSQFEVDSIYSQINYQGKPYRVSPLIYADAIRWFTNQSEGIPGYIMIDMTTQESELVRLEEGIQYSESEYFNRNIHRHLRFNYPTYIFDQLSFEIDDEGIPYYVAPVKQFNIGLFGGVTVGKVVLCNAVTGETVEYTIDEVPTWVDRAYPADLLVELFDYHGTLKNGFINSVLGQRDCLVATAGYNYLAIEEDIWVYTGVTSVTSDQSNVGFVLMNQRTMETKYYSVEGATETSAMSSAEGQVQNLQYRATFPLLLNVSNEPTYFVALKDGAGLVKKYAMVNVQQYQLVAIGDTVIDCEEAYIELLLANGVSEVPEDEREDKSLTGEIEKISEVVLEGNTHYLIQLENSNEIFDVKVLDYIDVVRFDVGERVTIEYKDGEELSTIISIE